MLTGLVVANASCLLNKRPGMMEPTLVTRVERGQEQVGKANAPIA